MVSGTEVPNAVEITAAGSVNFAFVPTSGSALRTAVAVPAPSACFRLGSFAVGVDTAQANLLNQLLPGLLNISSVSGTLVGYQGLAAANVSLLDLVGVSGLGVGTPDELLKLDGLTLGQFYAAMATRAPEPRRSDGLGHPAAVPQHARQRPADHRHQGPARHLHRRHRCPGREASASSTW